MHECPLDVDELGFATWRFLHTTAAYYPHTPTEQQKQSARELIRAVGELYACPHCAPDFRYRVLCGTLLIVLQEIDKKESPESGEQAGVRYVRRLADSTCTKCVASGGCASSTMK